MKRIFLRLKQPLRNERGEITFFACFFVVGIVMLISFCSATRFLRNSDRIIEKK